jgi:hypothetical protein
MPSQCSVADVRAKCAGNEVSGIEKLYVTVTLADELKMNVHDSKSQNST